MKKKLGTLLHCVATGVYALCLFFVIQFVLEVMKGYQILPYIKDYWISFGGAREVFSDGLVAVIVARMIDLYARRLNPTYARARGWPKLD